MTATLSFLEFCNFFFCNFLLYDRYSYLFSIYVAIVLYRIVYLPIFRRSDGFYYIFGTIYRLSHRKAIVGRFFEGFLKNIVLRYVIAKECG